MPIIGSLLNNDWYKATMGGAVHRHYPDVVIGACFTNRNRDFPLARHVDQGELEEELAALQELHYTRRELDFLRSLDVLSPAYIDSLIDFQMPEVHVERYQEQLRIEAEGPWSKIMPVEVPVLSIVTELVSRNLAKEAGLEPADIRREGHQRLDEAIRFFKFNPRIRFSLFGTRRHFSAAWEYEATARLVQEVPDQVVGISNIGLAQEFGYPVTGTIAHEYFMVPTMIHIARGTENPIGAAQNETMDNWEEEYLDKWGGGLLCAIPDTFGTETFLRYFTTERAEKWITSKQDSGPPQRFVNLMLAWLHDHDLDSAVRRIIHTDALDLRKMFELENFCAGRYMVGNGWGTKSTNNVGVATHSLVWKPHWVLVGQDKIPVVKLTDNRAKRFGDQAMLELVEKLAGYTNTFSELQTV